MPDTCYFCEKPIENQRERFSMGGPYQNINQIPMSARRQTTSPIMHYDCIKDPENLDHNQKERWTFLTAVKNKATLETLRSNVERIEDALLQSTDPALVQFQNEIQHIRETHPTDQ